MFFYEIFSKKKNFQLKQFSTFEIIYIVDDVAEFKWRRQKRLDETWQREGFDRFGK
jgi:hypothetical protein